MDGKQLGLTTLVTIMVMVELGLQNVLFKFY